MANNKGYSVFKNSRGTYTAQATIGYDENGKAIRKSFTADTKVDAISKLLPYIKGTEKVVTTSNVLPLRKHMLYWLMTYYRYTVSSRTFAKKISDVKRHIFSVIGDYAPKDITTDMLQTLLVQFLSKGYSYDTVSKLKGILNAYFEYCIDEQIITANPVLRIKINARNLRKKQSAENKNKAIPEKYRDAFMKALDTSPFMKAFCMTAILSGGRPAELLALKWKDYDKAAQSLRIDKATTVDYDFDDEGNITSAVTIIGDTKTAGSVRTNPISQTLCNILDEWKDYRKIQEEILHTSLTDDEDYIFATNRGELRSYQGTRHMFEKFLAVNGLSNSGIHLYCLRHTFSNDLFANGENPRVVQLLMGHSKVTTTMIYNTENSPKSLSNAVDKQNQKYAEEKPTQTTDAQKQKMLLDIIKRNNLRLDDLLAAAIKEHDDFEM